MGTSFHNYWRPSAQTLRPPNLTQVATVHCRGPTLRGPGVPRQQQSRLSTARPTALDPHQLPSSSSTHHSPSYTHQETQTDTQKDGRNRQGQRPHLHSKETRSSRPFSPHDRFRHTAVPTRRAQGLTPVPTTPFPPSTCATGYRRGAEVLQTLLHGQRSRGNSQARRGPIPSSAHTNLARTGSLTFPTCHAINPFPTC